MNEPGGDAVKQLMEKAVRHEVNLNFSLINYGELYYMAYKKLDKARAQSMVSDTRRLPIQIHGVTEAHVWEAAELKASYPISYADAFAASLARSLDVPVVTGDPEFRNITNGLKIFWILQNHTP